MKKTRRVTRQRDWSHYTVVWRMRNKTLTEIWNAGYRVVLSGERYDELLKEIGSPPRVIPAIMEHLLMRRTTFDERLFTTARQSFATGNVEPTVAALAEHRDERAKARAEVVQSFRVDL